MKMTISVEPHNEIGARLCQNDPLMKHFRLCKLINQDGRRLRLLKQSVKHENAIQRTLVITTVFVTKDFAVKSNLLL